MTTRLRPEVVAFDVNETLLDLAPVRAALVEAGEPHSLLGTVFARTLLTGIAAATTGTWCRFRDAFDAALAQESDLSADQQAPPPASASSDHRLTGFQDHRQVCARRLNRRRQTEQDGA